MWGKPWKYKEGFVTGAGLLLLGAVLQLLAGPVEWSVFAWPVNLIVVLLYIGALIGLYLLRKRFHPIEWLMHLTAAVPAMAYAVALTLVMGLTSWDMLGFWPFVLVYTWATTIIGLATIGHICRFKLREIPFILNHLGLFIAIIAGTLGNPDIRKCTVITTEGASENRGMDEDGRLVELPFDIFLHDFQIDFYPQEELDLPDSTEAAMQQRVPRRFASDVTVTTRKGERHDGVIEVNRPLKVEGWKIYQQSYDQSMGEMSRISVLQAVRDSWLPLVYLGIFMLLAGAALNFITAASKKGGMK